MIKSMSTQWGLQFRVITIAVLLSIITQFMFTLIAYRNSQEIGEDIIQRTQDSEFLKIYQSVNMVINDMYALSTSLQGADFVDYVVNYWGLKDSTDANQQRKKLNDRLNEIIISSSIIDHVYFLGKYSYQKQFSKKIGDKEWENISLPNIDELENLGVYSQLINDSGVLTYYKKGELTGNLNKLATRLPSKQYNGIKSFVEDRLEQKFMISSGSLGVGSAEANIIITLHPDFIKSIIPESRDSDGFITMLDQKGNMLWTTATDAMLINQITLESRKVDSGTFSIPGHSSNYSNRSKEMNPSNFKLVYTTHTISNSVAERHLLQNYVILSIISLIVVVVITYFLAFYTLYPLKALSNRLKQQTKLFPLKIIQKQSISKWIFPSLQMRGKMLLIFYVTVFIPAILSSLFYSQFMYSYSEQRLSETSSRGIQQTIKGLQLKADSYEKMISLLAVNSGIQQYYHRSGVLPREPKMPETYYSLNRKIEDISYYVLYNNQGTALYSSIFASNPNLLNKLQLDTQQFNELTNQTVFWLPNSLDIFKRKNLSLVKKVPLIEGDSEHQGGNRGYLQIFFKESAFGSFMFMNNVNMILTDKAGDLLFQTDIQKEYYEKVKKTKEEKILSKTTTITSMPIQLVEDVHQTIQSGYMDELQWNFYIFQPVEGIISKIREMSYRYLVVVAGLGVLIFVIAWVFAYYIHKPMERLRNRMENFQLWSNDVKLSPTANDEIGQLIRSYNEMAIRINQLVTENMKVMEENASNKLREQELIALKTKAELYMLQQQINPHFLYNVLEAINMRSARYGATDVSTMVSALADIFRYCTDLETELVILATEIGHVKNYVKIQEIRFRDRFTVEWFVDERTLDAPVLKFILQPIVENAIQHGFAELNRRGIIQVYITMQEKSLVIEVKDNGIGIEKEQLNKIKHSWQQGNQGELPLSLTDVRKGSSGVGMRNVYRRLKLYYHNESEMEISSELMKGTIVTISIPHNPHNISE
ncbi:sensor histidine kinase [Cohnella abietis]|uniref:histidine kinase n=1 Tax=Cohnella abietis TaxID=2507935 RepID=A0A3T1D0F6_9BACL|nr:sensor histidine kinase [Cohnella abietis]BBI31583.1 hypothetical protein KCTCHS21_09820 [Cohnella abietis]